MRGGQKIFAGARYPTMSDPSQVAPAYKPNDTTTKPASGGPMRKIILVLILVLFAALIVWRIRSSNAAQQAEADKQAMAASRATPVQVAAVQQKTVPVFLTALGTVTAYNTVTINSRVSGQMLAVNFREGQNVRKGQLLMEIDPRPYQAAVDQAVGQLAKDEANLKNTDAEAQRYTALYQAGVVSKESQQLQVSNQGQAAGTIKADQAAIEAAKVNLAYCRIVSPIDGVVGLRQVDPGNIVNAGVATSLVVITQVQPIAVIFTLPEDQLPQVQKAMKASGKPLTVEAYDRGDSHLIATGTLLTIDNQIDTTTGTAKLKAVFKNDDNSLFANQFVNVRLILNERPNATIVPTAAISSGTQGDYVFVVNQGPTPPEKRKNLPPAIQTSGKAPAKTSGDAAAAKEPKGPPMHVDSVPVHVDFTLGTSSVLTDGALTAGQQVVIDGQEKLVDGSNVSVVQPKQPGGKGGAGGASEATGTTTHGAGRGPAGGSSTNNASGKGGAQK
jgi:multidrug efflux system membrane fusion protein